MINDRGLLESFMRIRNMPEFAAFKTFLKEQEMKHLVAAGTLNEDRPTHLAQGAYRAIKALNDLIEDAPVSLNKERQQ